MQSFIFDWLIANYNNYTCTLIELEKLFHKILHILHDKR